jgi:hypothetical protein
MTMTMNDLLRKHRPLFAPEDGTGAGGEGNSSADAGTGQDGTGAAGVAVVLGGAKPVDGEDTKSGDAPAAPEGGQPPKDGEPETKDDADGKTDLDVVPADGKYVFDMPEGVELDQGLADAFAPAFAKIGLTQAQANELVGVYTQATQQQAQAQVDNWVKTNDDWLAAAKADKAITGMGWDTAVTRANAALARFDPEGELSEALAKSAVNGNHPALIRALARAGAALADDKTETGTSAAPEPAHEDRWYKPKG